MIPAIGPFPFLTELADITDATTANDPPFPPLEASFDTNITRSVWYKFAPATSGLYTFSSSGDTATTIKDTSMILYRSSTADCAGTLSIVAFNEDSGSLRSAISTNVTAGNTYFLVVWVGRTEVITNADIQRLDLQLRVSKPAPATNDTCATAAVIPGTLTAPYATAIFDTTRAAKTVGLIPPCATNTGTAASRNLWFKFTPSTTGAYIFSTGSDTATTINDTVMEIYTLNGGCGTAPSEIACNDNGLGRAVVSSPLSAGTTYYIVVWDNSPSYIPGETLLQLRVSPSTAPSVTTLPPSRITSTSTMLNGIVNPNGVVSRFWFEWGTTTSLGTKTPVKLLLGTPLDFNTNIAVTAFQPNVLYYYQMVATNTLGMTRGAIETFLWNNTPPVIISAEAVLASDRIFRVEFTGQSNHFYRVEYTTNLINWIDAGAATEVGSSTFELQHSAEAPSTKRFFRIKSP